MANYSCEKFAPYAKLVHNTSVTNRQADGRTDDGRQPCHKLGRCLSTVG